MDADALIQSASAREELACDVYCQFQTFDADHSGHLGFRELGQALSWTQNGDDEHAAAAGREEAAVAR